jgi:hypothetical protein
MKKGWWILAILGLVLLVWSFVRERFEPTQSIKAPPYGKEEKIRIFDMALQNSDRAPYRYLGYQDTLLRKVKEQNPSLKPFAEEDEEGKKRQKELAGGLVSPTIEAFFTEVYRPASVPITEAQIDTFLSTRSSDLKDIEKQILKTYFIDQSGVGTGMQTGYAEELARMGQNYGYMSPNAPGPVGESGTTPGPDPSCPSGFTIDSEKLTCKPTTGVAPSCPSGYPVSDSSPNSVKCFQTTLNEGEFRIKECPTGTTRGQGGLCYGASQPSTCPSGFQLDRQQIHDGTGNIRSVGKCKSTGATTGASAGATGTTGGTGMSQNTSVSTTTGTTTGGSSTSSFGPNSGRGRRGQVFGPTFNGAGDGDGNVRPADSTKINSYPELLGGGDGKPSTRIEGAGIVNPSKNWQLTMDGSLPSSASLGSDENSKYFPYSRQPGDMDLIPDPYRVSQQFSSASYSFKTEPTPFLTDFSAFLR